MPSLTLTRTRTHARARVGGRYCSPSSRGKQVDSTHPLGGTYHYHSPFHSLSHLLYSPGMLEVLLSIIVIRSVRSSETEITGFVPVYV